MSCNLPIDTNEFKLRINISAPTEQIYKSLTTPFGLESWFLRKAGFKDKQACIRSASEFVQKDDEYTFLWHGYTDDTSEKGIVLEANGKDLFCFSFSMNCRVEIKIYTELETTIIELTQSNFPKDEETLMRHYIGDSRGWVFYLANLKSILEGGLDLRNKNPDIKNVISS